MEKKENFIKKAFKDMAENAKVQHEVDKANFEAVKAESKTNFEENRWQNTLPKAKASLESAKMSPSEKQEKMQEERMRQIEQANARKAEAEKRYEQAKVVKK